MNGNFNIKDIETMSSQLFDWEHSSRNTGHTVMGLHIDEDSTFKLECWLGLTVKGYTKDETICHEGQDGNYKSVAIALEYADGEWFWMHINDYSSPITEPKVAAKLVAPVKGLVAPVKGLTDKEFLEDEIDMVDQALADKPKKTFHRWECDCGYKVDFRQPELPFDNYNSEANESKSCPHCPEDMYFDEVEVE